MSTASTKNDSREKAKMAAIPVLLLVFVYVVYSQIAGEDEASDDVSHAAAPVTSVATTTTVTAPLSSNAVAIEVTESVMTAAAVPLSEREWYETPLEQIVQHDPFLKTNKLKSKAEILAETQPQTLDQLPVSIDDQQLVEERMGSVKTKILIKSDKGSAAYVGTRLVREGDIWEEGIRIKSIELNGVIVGPDQGEEAEAEPSQEPSSMGDRLKSFFPLLAPPPRQ